MSSQHSTAHSNPAVNTSHIKPVSIAIDVDGVLADFTRSFVAVINHLWPGKLPDDYQPNDWNYSDSLSREELDIAWAEAMKIEDFAIHHPPLKGVKHLIDMQDELWERNISVYFVTHRPPSAGRPSLQLTNLWLLFAGVNMDRASVIVVSKSDDKAALYKLLDVKFSLDDRPETVYHSNEHFDDHQAYVLDQLWNRDDKWSSLPRVKTVAEFIRLVTITVDKENGVEATDDE